MTMMKEHIYIPWVQYLVAVTWGFGIAEWALLLSSDRTTYAERAKGKRKLFAPQSNIHGYIRYTIAFEIKESIYWNLLQLEPRNLYWYQCVPQ